MKKTIVFKTLVLLLSAYILAACGDSSAEGIQSGSISLGDKDTAAASSAGKEKDKSKSTKDDTPSAKVGSRDSTPHALVPEASGEIVYSCPEATIDASHAAEGYIMVSYTGSSPKVKFQLTGPNEVTYTYNLHGGYEVFPLASGNGTYKLGVFENIEGTQYSTAMSETIEVSLSNEFGPFLYPNQYISFDSSKKVFNLSGEVAKPADSDLDVVGLVYNYVADNITYDYDLASNVASGYLPDPDRTIDEKKGICLDYASLMCALLRIQNIPTHLEVGYAGDVYHAWVSVYIKDIGWINGMIQFDGESWKIMDPTFASNSSEEALKSFIGEGNNYVTKYVY